MRFSKGSSWAPKPGWGAVPGLYFNAEDAEDRREEEKGSVDLINSLFTSADLCAGVLCVQPAAGAWRSTLARGLDKADDFLGILDAGGGFDAAGDIQTEGSNGLDGLANVFRS